MATCLIGLGSNEGDREATLAAAVAAIDALPDVQLTKHSTWHATTPIGGPAGQGAYLNGAAVLRTSTAPLILLKELQQIEERLGRQPGERWSARPIDIDILLYDREVMEQAMITVPHPRMSFRRFVLGPSAEVSPKMIHPIIGWPVERLLLHLDSARDLVAIVSPSETVRHGICQKLASSFAAANSAAPELGTAAAHWPTEWTTWLSFERTTAIDAPAAGRAPLAYAAAAFPKLTMLVDPEPASPRPILSKWATLVRQPGRGPTLRIPHNEDAIRQGEASAAIAAVWPDQYGPT